MTTNLEQRIAARREAEEFVSLIDDEKPRRFWEVVLELANEKLGLQVSPLVPMTDAQASEFEQQEMKFGKFSGIAIGDVDCPYLEWLADTNSFSRELLRYVKSDRFARRQRMEG